MVLANTPGQRNGRIAVWLDGKLVADFMNLRFRDIESLKIDRFQLCFHIRSNPNGETKNGTTTLLLQAHTLARLPLLSQINHLGKYIYIHRIEIP